MHRKFPHVNAIHINQPRLISSFAIERGIGYFNLEIAVESNMINCQLLHNNVPEITCEKRLKLEDTLHKKLQENFKNTPEGINLKIRKDKLLSKIDKLEILKVQSNPYTGKSYNAELYSKFEADRFMWYAECIKAQRELREIAEKKLAIRKRSEPFRCALFYKKLS